MLLNRISLRAATAVGSAAMVAGATFAVSAFADSGVQPEQASSAAVPGEEKETEAADDFFGDPKALSDDERDQAEEQRKQASAAGAAAAAGMTQAEEEEEEEEAESDSADDSAVPDGDPKSIAKSLLGDYGWSASEFDCLEPLWEQESSWDPSAENPSSGAYGIPQALPGSKMASEGSDWQTNPATQIKWGLGYIDDRYGSPCEAHSHSQANGWY
ncbi:aggregation-promoting factor C-terminal-like domain-containing protein [Allosalinactinospora lopnorensis]|uniref:aggregation-promoting factor C-terminal-like domain-containing protein n=1 Tax=Allosalinactinospora lopnorensis TaxID=1352348 RepID=UPI000623F816|nr:lytic transglycosylase domain-containing protein [Allosalinactinospora lopnorensis]